MAEFTARQIGKYQIQAELGRGGFGTVYRAYDPTVGRLVAIKVLTASGDQQLLTRFKNEAAAAGNLRHKNILTIYDFGEHEGLAYIVMEFLEGEDLQQVISRKKPLTLLEKVSIMLQVADGLHCAHRSGVVHRDVKPGNIRLLPDGTVKIMDFGIARVMAAGGGAARLTRQGHVIGTLLYMAPEQVRGGEVDFLCDIFAYGITYYELLAGKHPFQGSDPRAVFYRITTEDPEPIRNIVHDCPEALEAIVNRTLNKERELRYQSFREVQLDSEPLLIELRQVRATTLLAEAKRLYSAGQMDSAQSVLNEAFDLDPGNRGARQLRETIQQQLLRRVIEPKIQSLLEKGDSLLAERLFPEAVETFEAALRLDRENAAISERLKRARELLNNSRESARLVAEARRELARNNLESALQTLPETLELDPGNPDARQLFEEIRQELTRREQDREREKKLQEAKDLLANDRFDDALRQLDGLQGGDSIGEEAGRVAEQIKTRKQAHEHQQKIGEELASARELMGSGQHEMAIRRLERLMNAYPEEAEATKLFIVAHKKLAAQRKDQLLDRLETELPKLLEARQFDRAVEIVNDALRDYPAEPRLADATREVARRREEYQRSEAVREALEMAQGFTQQDQPEAAEQALEAAIARYPHEERLVSALSVARQSVQWKRREQAVEALRREAESAAERSEFDRAIAAIERGIETHGADSRLTGTLENLVRAKAKWERAETIREALRHSEQCLASNDPKQAEKALTAALRQYPGDEQLTAALAPAREMLEAQQREADITALAGDARGLLDRLDFEGALSRAEAGLTLFRDDRLTNLRKEIVEAKAAWERSEAVRTALEQSQHLLDRDDPEGAIAVLESAVRGYPDEDRLSKALVRARDAAEIKRREAAIETVCRNARSRLANRHFDEALAELEHGLESFGNDTRLIEAKEKVLAGKADWERSEAIRQTLASAREFVAHDDPESALDLIEKAQRQYPGEQRLTAAASDARKSLEEKRREQAVQTVLLQAASHLERREFDRALVMIEEAGRTVGDDQRLTGLRREVENAQAAWVRSETVRNALRDSEHRLADSDPEGALRLLEAALARYPDETSLSQAAAAARQALEHLRRETAIEAICREGTALTERREFDHALDQVKQGLRTLGHDERLANLKGRIVAARLEWHRAETVRIALENSREQLARNDPDGAVQTIEAALARYPQEAQLQEAVAAAREARELKRREADIAAACSEAESQLARRRFDEAIARLDRAIETNGADRRLAEARDLAVAAKTAHEREDAIQGALSEARRRVSRNDPEGAVEALQPALSRFPEDERLSSAAAVATQALEQKRRTKAIDLICREVSGATERREFDAAIEAISRGISEFGSDPRLTRLQQETAAAKDQWLRSERIRSALQDCRQRLANGDPEGALEALETPLKDFPDDPQLLKERSTARQALEAKQRTAAVDKLTKHVRQCLKRHDFDGAIAPIQKELEVYPGDPQLTQLLQKVAVAREEWEREQNVRRALLRGAELQADNHFADALHILRQALEKYPGEPRLATAHREIQADYQRQQSEARLNATLEEAIAVLDQDPESAVRLLEAALAEHPDEPRVLDALDRARQSRAARQRDETIDALCRETSLYLQSGDFGPALETIEGALKSFGEEQRLAKMRETVLASKADWDRAEGIRQAVEEASSFAERGELATAVESLLSATKIYGPEDRLIEALTVTRAAVEKQRQQEAIERICREVQAEVDAQRLDEAARMLDDAEQAHGPAPEFSAMHRRVISERERLERAEAVRRALEDANRLLQQNEPEPAIVTLDAALTRYPGDPGLLELRSRAVQVLAARQKEFAIQQACRDIEAAISRQDFKGALKQIQSAHKLYGRDGRLDQLRADVDRAKAAAKVQRRTAQATAAGSLQRVQKRWLLAAAAGALIVAVGVGATLRNRFVKSRETVRLEVQSSPPNAVVKVGDQSCTTGGCSFDLKPGTHHIQVSADGYEPKTEEARLSLGEAGQKVTVALSPLHPTVQVTANFAQGEVAMDGAPKGPLQDGQFVLNDVQPGRHDLRISGTDGSATLSFQTEFAQLPTLGAVSAAGLDAVAFGAFGDRVAVSCAGCTGSVFADDRPAGELKDGAITIGSLSAGTHELRLTGQSGERKFVFTLGGAPSVNLAIASYRNYGTLVVETGEDAVSVFIDGRLYPRRTARGQLRLPVEATQHTIRVAKDGYKAEPTEFRADVKKGDQLQARFRLTAEPARLSLTDGVPGAIVKIDDRPVGTVSADGSFSTAVSPGEHRIELTKDGFTPVATRRRFSAGGAVQLGRDQTHMAAAVESAAARGATGGTSTRTPPNNPPPEVRPPDPAALESAEWERISRNPTNAEIEEFLQKYPSGNNAREAHRLLERLEWGSINKSSRQALQAFLTKYPAGAYASQAAAEIARLDHDAATRQQNQQDVERLRTERDQVRALLRGYGEAYAQKDANQIVALWPSMPARNLRDIRASFRDFQKLSLELRPLGEPEIVGTTARVQCKRITDAVDRYGSHPTDGTVTVQCEKRNGRWVIDSIQ